MTLSTPVCILTAGRGTRMGPLADVINKSLLPYKGKAIISHIISSFPKDTPFIIALGYQDQQVRDYLSIVHPELNIQFVEVDRYEGEGTGPGYSLLCCRSYLESPFYFVSCDTLFSANLDKAPESNWVGVASVSKNQQANYCNMQIMKGEVTGILDKQKVDKQTSAFTGFMYIHDYQIFWQALVDKNYISGEHQISNGLLGLLTHSKLYSIQVKWLDLGTYEKYRQAIEETEEYDFSKTNEFLYFTQRQVIKFFNDETIVRKRVEKASLKKHVFPSITYVGKQFYSYDFVSGQTLYAYNHPELFDKLLIWLERELWTPVAVSAEKMSMLCGSFYKEKTHLRLADYAKKYPNTPSCSIVNGRPVASLEQLMNDIPWDELCCGVPTFMHGDLQFDNILYDKKTNQFVLLDWRQDFAGEVKFGDIYYDLAKLMGGIIINYDYIKAGLFSVEKDSNELYLEFAQRFNRTYYLLSLKQFIERQGLDFKRVQLLVGLIYLNMSPLHHPPFDQALEALGRLLLTTTLYNCSESILVKDVEVFV